jgi:hypothetical protein
MRDSIMAVQSHRINRQDTPSRGHATFLSCIPPAPPPSLDSNYGKINRINIIPCQFVLVFNQITTTYE